MTHVCENTFSTTKQIKSKNINQMLVKNYRTNFMW